MQRNSLFEQKKSENSSLEFVNDDEKAIYERVLDIVNSKKPRREEGLIKNAMKFEAWLFLKLINKSDDIKIFFERAGTPFWDAIVNELIAKKHPSKKIISLDGKQEISVLNLHLGIKLFQQYEKETTKQPFLLDEACKRCWYDALTKRADINLEKIKSSDTDSTEKGKLVVQLCEDLQQLGNCYLTVGYLHATYIFWDLARYLAEQHAKAETEDQKKAWGKSIETVSIAAAGSFFCAEMLIGYQKEELESKGKLENPQLLNDKMLMDTISNGKGMKMYEDIWQKSIKEVGQDLLKMNSSFIEEAQKYAKEKIDSYVQQRTSGIKANR